jgi:diaminopimelate decarboxylase
LRQLAVLAELNGATVQIGVRLNPDVTADTHPYISTGKGGLKFGVPMDQLPAVLEVLDETTALQLSSIAMHLGSQLHSSEPYLAGIQQLTGALESVRERGHAPKVLDIGGGLGIRYHDENTLSPLEWVTPLRDALLATGCNIHVEPGRYLVGSSGVLLTKVIHRKHSGGRDIAIVDAGMNDLLRPSLYKAWHQIIPVMADDSIPVPTDIVGPVCETGDFLALERPLQPVPAGAILAVLGAGAYSFAMSSNYNSRARAPEVMVDDSRWAVVRPRERLTDLFATEVADPFATEQP